MTNDAGDGTGRESRMMIGRTEKEVGKTEE